MLYTPASVFAELGFKCITTNTKFYPTSVYEVLHDVQSRVKMLSLIVLWYSEPLTHSLTNCCLHSLNCRLKEATSFSRPYSGVRGEGEGGGEGGGRRRRRRRWERRGEKSELIIGWAGMDN